MGRRLHSLDRGHYGLHPPGIDNGGELADGHGGPLEVERAGGQGYLGPPD